MNEPRFHIDQDQMLEFAQACEGLVTQLRFGRYVGTGNYAGTTADYTPVKWLNGVKVTLGTVEYDHSGRDAGEILSKHIGGGVDALDSAEQGFRALASITRRALEDFSNQDSISAGELLTLVAEYLPPPKDSEA